MTKVREHRGSLSDAMETVFEVADFNGLVDHMRKTLEPYGQVVSPELVKVQHYTYDDRIGWDTYIVSIEGYGVWGFTDGPLSRADRAGDPMDCQPPDPKHLAARGVRKKRGAK